MPFNPECYYKNPITPTHLTISKNPAACTDSPDALLIEKEKRITTTYLALAPQLAGTLLLLLLPQSAIDPDILRSSAWPAMGDLEGVSSSSIGGTAAATATALRRSCQHCRWVGHSRTLS